jgi:hypothetical protein
MKLNLEFSLGLLVAVTALAFVWSAQRLWSTRSDLEVARQQDVQSAKLIAEVRHLRSLPAIIEEAPIREDRILGLVSDCLSQSGVNPAAIRDVSSESQAGGTTTYRRQNIRVQLDSLSVPDVGRFLSTWNKLHPTWTPTTINLSPAQKNEGGKAGTTSVAWAATVVFTSTYLATAPTSRIITEPPPSPTAPRRGTLMPEIPAR